MSELNAVLDTQIPFFSEGVYDYDIDIDSPYTLRLALNNLKVIVDSVEKATTICRNNDFEPEACAAALDWYYFDGPPDDHNLYPSERQDNYYYILTSPQLLDVEYALEIISNVPEAIRYAVTEMKARLWRLLPDFYAAHTNPPLKPLSYDPNLSYPYPCIDESLSATRRYKTAVWRYGLSDAHEYADLMPADDSPVSKLDFGDGDVTIDGRSAPTSIFWTEMWLFEAMLTFAEDVLCRKDATSLFIDPEGPPVKFCTQPSMSSENVKLVIHWDSNGSMRGAGTVIDISAIVNRRQLVNSIIKACESIVQEFYEIANTRTSSNKNVSSRYGEEYIVKIQQQTEKLKALL